MIVMTACELVMNDVLIHLTRFIMISMPCEIMKRRVKTISHGLITISHASKIVMTTFITISHGFIIVMTSLIMIPHARSAI
jgi:hypothetical protein